MDKVTKPKNAGRVAAGKRTAELNRKRKEDLLRNRKTVPPQVDSDTEEVPRGHDESSQAYKYGGLTIIAAVLGFAVFFFWKRDSMKITSPPVQQPENDDYFCMN